MIKIEYPPYQPKIKTENKQEFIFDAIRKRWVLLTPEEWVRQNFLQYLIEVMHYPSSLISVEKEINLGELKKRYDIVVYDKNHLPWLVVECKGMEVSLDRKVLDQALRYNITLQVPFIVITNGAYCYAFENVDMELKEVEALPEFIL
ncbi:MAG: type I restriction enzyme HsdR N-terminal domain-containing protein [Chitinophagaceae bacterium]|nr:type I restriction enzyme HsdR N-terminal domain-containing protein [Chitinophagaceae bacterium]